MLIGTSAQLRAAVHILENVVAGANLKPMAVIKSLGVILDSRLTFAAQVTTVCKACNYHIWALRHIRHLLTHDVGRRQHISEQHRGSTHWLFQLNLARCIHVVDYQAAKSAELVVSCSAAATETNSCGTPSAVTSLAARRTSGDLQAGRSYVQRVTPAYLNSLISNRVTASKMSLRSSTRSLMAVPRTNTVCASRSFSVCAPVVWNSLPPYIQLRSCLKAFKSKLKTFLFCRAFDIWPVAKRLCILELHSQRYINDFTCLLTYCANINVFNIFTKGQMHCRAKVNVFNILTRRQMHCRANVNVFINILTRGQMHCRANVNVFNILTRGQMHCRASVITNDVEMTGRKLRIFGYMSRGESVYTNNETTHSYHNCNNSVQIRHTITITVTTVFKYVIQ